MRNNLFFVLSVIILAASSCEKNKIEEPAINTQIAGEYSGYSSASCNYFSDKITENEKATVTANADGTVDVIFNSSTWSEFKISKATCRKEGDSFIFEGKGSAKLGMGGDQMKDYDFTMNGKTDAAKEKYSILYTIPDVMGGLKIELLPGKPAEK
ncbi:MAG: calycin-like domain-containing protein [Candidatus Coprenecus sp.]